MLMGTVYIHEEVEATRRQEKAMEDDRSRKKVVEPYGSL